MSDVIWSISSINGFKKKSIFSLFKSKEGKIKLLKFKIIGY